MDKQTIGAGGESLAESPPDYSESLFLPRTDFPMRGGLPKKEPELLARWQEIGLYGVVPRQGGASRNSSSTMAPLTPMATSTSAMR